MERCIFKVFFSQHHNHDWIFNTFSTNLHAIFSIELKFSCWIKFSWIEIEFSLIGIEFNSIQVAYKVIKYFHFNGIWFSQNQFIFFINWLVDY
jgi:hypothetical protein